MKRSNGRHSLLVKISSALKIVHLQNYDRSTRQTDSPISDKFGEFVCPILKNLITLGSSANDLNVLYIFLSKKCVFFFQSSTTFKSKNKEKKGKRNKICSHFCTICEFNRTGIRSTNVHPLKISSIIIPALS